MDLYSELHAKGMTVIGGQQLNPVVEEPFNRWTVYNNKNLLLYMVQKKYLKVKELISHRYKWDKADESYYMLSESKDNAIGVILEW